MVGTDRRGRGERAASDDRLDARAADLTLENAVDVAALDPIQHGKNPLEAMNRRLEISERRARDLDAADSGDLGAHATALHSRNVIISPPGCAGHQAAAYALQECWPAQADPGTVRRRISSTSSQHVLVAAARLLPDNRAG